MQALPSRAWIFFVFFCVLLFFQFFLTRAGICNSRFKWHIDKLVSQQVSAKKSKIKQLIGGHGSKCSSSNSSKSSNKSLCSQSERPQSSNSRRLPQSATVALITVILHTDRNDRLSLLREFCFLRLHLLETPQLDQLHQPPAYPLPARPN
jgi:hypothetical protein